MSGELDGLPTGATSENKETSGPPRPPATADPPSASGEKRTGPPPAPITATVRVEEEENIQEMGGMLEDDDQDGPDSERKGLRNRIVDEEEVDKEKAVGEAGQGSSLTHLVVLVVGVGGVVLILATLLLTVCCLAYRRHRRTKRTYQLSGGNEQQQQLPATTTTRF